MKWILFVVLFTGCVSVDLDADHVKKERATYDAIQPFVQAGIASMGTSTNAKAGTLLNTSWEERIVSYEERLAKRQQQ